MGVKWNSWVRTTAGHLALVVGPRLVEAGVAFGVVVHVGVGISAVDEVDCFGVLGGGEGGGGKEGEEEEEEGLGEVHVGWSWRIVEGFW